MNAKPRSASRVSPKPEPLARVARGPQKSRRDVVESQLKDFEERHKKSNRGTPLSVRITRSGLILVETAIRDHLRNHRACDVCPWLRLWYGPAGRSVLGFVGAFGIPRWLLSFLRKRRETQFLEGLPDAVDIIVRGVKAGLPLLDCIKMITRGVAPSR